MSEPELQRPGVFPAVRVVVPQACRSMCIYTGNANPAALPACSTIFASPERVNGAPRSVYKGMPTLGPVASQLPERADSIAVERSSYKRLLTVFPLPEPVIHQAWHR